MPCRLRLLILLALVAASASCQTTGPTTPKVVQTAVTRYVPVPDRLTAPCVIAMPENNTVGEAVRVARARRAALEKCNGQLTRIRELAQ